MYDKTFPAMRVMFITSTMSVASLRSFVDVSIKHGNRIFLSTLVWFGAGLENSAAMVLSWAAPHLTVVVRIYLFTIYHVYTGVFDTPATAILAMLWRGCAGRCVIFASYQAGVRLGQVARGVGRCVRLGPCFVFACSCCLGVCLPTSTATILGSGIIGTRRPFSLVSMFGGSWLLPS